MDRPPPLPSSRPKKNAKFPCPNVEQQQSGDPAISGQDLGSGLDKDRSAVPPRPLTRPTRQYLSDMSVEANNDTDQQTQHGQDIDMPLGDQKHGPKDSNSKDFNEILSADSPMEVNEFKEQSGAEGSDSTSVQLGNYSSSCHSSTATEVGSNLQASPNTPKRPQSRPFRKSNEHDSDTNMFSIDITKHDISSEDTGSSMKNITKLPEFFKTNKPKGSSDLHEGENSDYDNSDHDHIIKTETSKSESVPLRNEAILLADTTEKADSEKAAECQENPSKPDSVKENVDNGKIKSDMEFDINGEMNSHSIVEHPENAQAEKDSNANYHTLDPNRKPDQLPFTFEDLINDEDMKDTSIPVRDNKMDEKPKIENKNEEMTISEEEHEKSLAPPVDNHTAKGKISTSTGASDYSEAKNSPQNPRSQSIPEKLPPKPHAPKPKSSIASRFEAALRESEASKPKPILSPKPRLPTGSRRVSTSVLADLNEVLSRGPPPVGRPRLGSKDQSSTDNTAHSGDHSEENSDVTVAKEFDCNDSAEVQINAMPRNMRRVRLGGRRRLPSTVNPPLSYTVPERPIWEMRENSDCFPSSDRQISNSDTLVDSLRNKIVEKLDVPQTSDSNSTNAEDLTDYDGGSGDQNHDGRIVPSIEKLLLENQEGMHRKLSDPKNEEPQTITSTSDADLCKEEEEAADHCGKID